MILSGQDVVAMARTGSGKTACFLLPMFAALKSHATNSGPRALVLTPTRELAEQVMTSYLTGTIIQVNFEIIMQCGDSKGFEWPIISGR